MNKLICVSFSRSVGMRGILFAMVAAMIWLSALLRLPAINSTSLDFQVPKLASNTAAPLQDHYARPRDGLHERIMLPDILVLQLDQNTSAHSSHLRHLFRSGHKADTLPQHRPCWHAEHMSSALFHSIRRLLQMAAWFWYPRDYRSSLNTQQLSTRPLGRQLAPLGWRLVIWFCSSCHRLFYGFLGGGGSGGVSPAGAGVTVPFADIWTCASYLMTDIFPR